MNKAFRNFKTLLSTKGMGLEYINWLNRSFGRPPRIKLPEGRSIEGFRNFSEFWSAHNMVPDSKEIAFMRRFSGDSGLIIDVGANLGTHALTMAAIREDCVVHAFEPSPQTVKKLKANVVLNNVSNIVIHPFALGNVPGKLQFNNDQSSPGTNRIISNAENSLSLSSIEVDVSTIDEFLGDYRDPYVSFLKIDVEGFEPNVLRGAKRTFLSRRIRVGLVELCPANLYQVGSSPEELLDTVDEMGFCLYSLNEEGLGAVIDINSATSTVLANVALVPKDFSV